MIWCAAAFCITCEGLNDCQDYFEAYLWYQILQLDSEYGTIALVIVEARTNLSCGDLSSWGHDGRAFTYNDPRVSLRSVHFRVTGSIPLDAKAPSNQAPETGMKPPFKQTQFHYDQSARPWMPSDVVIHSMVLVERMHDVGPALLSNLTRELLEPTTSI